MLFVLFAVLASSAGLWSYSDALKIVDTQYQVVLTNIPFEFSFSVEFEQTDLQNATTLFASLFLANNNEDMTLIREFNQSVWDHQTRLVTRFTFADMVLSNTGKQNVVAKVHMDSNSVLVSAKAELWAVNGFVTLLPLFLIMTLALLTQSVLPALFCGAWFAAFLLYENDLLVSFARTWDTIILGALMNRNNQLVILFVMCMGGLIEMINESNGSVGLANALSKLAKSSRSAQTVSLLFGIALFFDDYASALVVGGTMGPVIDRCFVSREKLAFIGKSAFLSLRVYATNNEISGLWGKAAPIAALIPITSWTAFESALLQTEANKLISSGVPFAALGYESSGFMGLLRMLQFAYYSIFLLFFQLVIILTGKEFGPMFSAERRARMREYSNTADDATATVEDAAAMEPKRAQPLLRNGFIPIMFFIVLVLILLVVLGAAAVPENEPVEINTIFAHVDSIQVMLYAVTLSSFVTAVLYRMQCLKREPDLVFWRNQPIMTLPQSLAIFVRGFSHLTPTVMILVLAWAMGTAIDALGAGRYFASSLQGAISPYALPSLIYIISSIVSYSTGSSWGSMALMYPICGPVAFQLSQQLAQQSSSGDIYYCAMAAILEGSVFGAHCSFICDTTIMSSMACKCPIALHVKTQVPYAIFVALVSLASGFALVGVVPIAITYCMGFVYIAAGVHLLGAKPDQAGTLDRISTLYCRFQTKILKRRTEDIEIIRLMQEHQRECEVALHNNGTSEGLEASFVQVAV